MHTIQTNLRQNYFKVVENGTRLFNVHRLLNGGAFIIGLIAMAIILAQEEFKEAMSPVQRHVIYGFSIIVVIFLQIFFRVAYPDVRHFLHYDAFVSGENQGEIVVEMDH